jgi:hypothetical protein
VKFCTVAHWKNGEIVEEELFYDLVGLMKQIGLLFNRIRSDARIQARKPGTVQLILKNIIYQRGLLVPE